MKHKMRVLFTLIAIASFIMPASVLAQSSSDTTQAFQVAPAAALTESIVSTTNLQAAPASSDAVTFTILHTNDFHGNLEPAGSNPGAARLAKVINDVRTSVGAANTLLFDAGDEMQGSLLSNLQKGAPTIDVFNNMGYKAATLGNHEFDWGQTVLVSRTQEATYSFLAANLVVKDTADCSTSGWTNPSFVKPWITTTVGTAPDQVVVGLIGATSQETPYITLAQNTDGLCFKDAKDSILHYYDQVKALSDVVVVLSHLGNTDGGYGYGFPVYGDQTLAKGLIAAGKPVDLIIGGHSHTNLSAAQVFTGDVGGKTVTTLVTQAYYAGRRVGRADFTVDKATGDVTITWNSLTVSPTGDKDPAIDALVASYASDPAYQATINQVVGYTNVPLVRDYNGDSLMAELVDDAIYNDLNNDAEPLNDVDMFFNNPGGIRTDIISTTYPYTLTYGAMFSVLPFGNQTIVGDMSGARILELLNQSATLFKGAIQPAGIRYKFYSYKDSLPGSELGPWAWGAYDVTVFNGSTWEPLDLGKVYRVGTNEFLAPAGQDGFTPFKYMTNTSYWGDMLDGVNRWITATYGTPAAAFNGPNNDGTIDDRIWRDGTNAGGSIVPINILHHNDSHGNLLQGRYVGYTQLATLIKQERQHNPDRTILLSGGDNIQGDSMMYYFKSAGLGYAADGTPLPTEMQINPLIAAFNVMTYTAMTLGNHEFNFGHTVFTSTLKQANFPILQANLSDDGSYGIDEVPVKPYITVTLGTEDIKLAILGIGNHRVPNYELPSNIQGLTFTNPITTAQQLAPGLEDANDAVVALTHIGFTTDPKSVEVDTNVDTVMAAETSGLDAIIGAHSHTNPATGFGDYKYLPTIVDGPGNTPVIINQAYRYNNTLGEVVLGMKPKTGGGYEVVARAGRYISVDSATPEDPEIKAIVTPYNELLTAYNQKFLGYTTAPIDALKAYTEETTGANLQADSAVWELAQHGIDVDFHLSGAMSNRKVADAATPTQPVTMTVSDMFTLMPYENSLVVLKMNGPQLKAVLERAYRNYYYYKYVPGFGGYSYYTTCMIDINAGGQITYRDAYPDLPDGNNVLSLVVNGKSVDFTDASKYYNVSTVNYLAAGSCNFNDSGTSLWPLSQITHDTQFYVRDAVIDYITAMGTVSPKVEGRLLFPSLYAVGKTGAILSFTPSAGLETSITIPPNAVTQDITLAYATTMVPQSLSIGLDGFSFLLEAVKDGKLLTSFPFSQPIIFTFSYTDDSVAGLVEDNLKLYYWDGNTWADAACGVYSRHPAENWLSVPVCHLSNFSLAARPLIYMPSVFQNY